MGYEFFFDKAKKFKNATIADIDKVKSYRNWFLWNRPGYETFEKYAESAGITPELPDQEIVDYYLAKDDDITENVGFICGWDNAYIAGVVKDTLKKKLSDEMFEVTDKEEIQKLLKWTDDELEKHRLIPVVVRGAVKASENGEGAVAKVAKLIIENEDGDQILYDVSYDQEIYVPSKGFDEYKKGALLHFKEMLEEILKIDFNEYFVWFEASY